ncbi:MAG: TRAP transporter substrate-binding protein DctP [Eubacteriales bacterium]
MKKKIISMILSVAMVASMMVGCGDSGSSTSTSTETTSTETATTEESSDAPGGYAGEKIELNYSNSSTPESQTGVAFGFAKEYMADASDGQITLNLHWNGSLFTQDQDLPACIKGSVDFISTQPAYISEYMPEYGFLTSAYFFESVNHWETFYASDIWAEMVENIASTVGVRVLSVETPGTRTINLRTDQEILSRDDLSSVKLRAQNSEAWLFLAEALGGNATPIAYSELYLSLQTGAVDGSEVTLISIKDMCLYEVLTSVTMSQHVVETNWIIINEDRWQNFTDEEREIVKAGITVETDFIINAGKENEGDLIALCEENGMTVYQPTTEQLTPYIQEVREYYSTNEAISKDWDMELYNAIQALAQ